MKLKLWQKFFLWASKRLLGLRYDITVKGLDRIIKKQLKKESGILFLPNHPAEIDPVILFAILMRNFNPRPLVVEKFYYMTGMHFFMRLARACPIPHVETTANQWELRRVEKAYKTIKEGLKSGENFLLYPSGHLKKEGYEVIGGNSFVHRLIHDCPDVKIVLIRTSGLWGSCFSRAITGEVPNFWHVFFMGMKILFKNWLIFAPRRKVLIEVAINPEDFPRQGTRLEINKYLEAWYNKYQTQDGSTVKDEPLTLVSYERGKTVYPEITHKGIEKEKKRLMHSQITVPPALKKQIFDKLAELAEIPVESIREDQCLSSDLGLDSLDVANIYTYLDVEFGIKDLKAGDLENVADVVFRAAGKIETIEHEEKVTVAGWHKEDDRPHIMVPDGSTLQEAFLRVCARMGNYSACADVNSGIVSYKKLKLAAIILSQKIKNYPGEYVGIMLPSSVGAYIAIFATLLAGKIPAMLNWTVGVRSLNYAIDLLGLKVILSSTKFLSKVETLDIGDDLEKIIVTLEDMKHGITLKDKLSGLFISRQKPKAIMRKLGIDKAVRPTDPAVILFTSGTETYPKAVPLSHKNILENQKAGISCVAFTTDDIIYGVLPPFHSFGFSATGTLPILAGIKAYFAPDPTNAKGMAKDVYNWKATILCSAPSFLRNLFIVANNKQLRSVRLFVTGAEKAPKELFDYVEKMGPKHQIIEGYGITECSPIVTICRPNRPIAGVGQPLSNIELCIIHPETQEVLPKGQIGEVCIHGDSVFYGYLGAQVKDPFIKINGKKWYCSGDLGSIDDEGNLILGGRLKRFVKVGGEMVSLNALEEELLVAARTHSWYEKGVQEGVPLAIGVNEALDRPAIVLFTTFPATREQVNGALRESGFGRIMKISEVRQIKEIPITGTGKIHYRKLNELAALDE